MFDFGISVKVGREDYGKVGNKPFPLFSPFLLSHWELYFFSNLPMLRKSKLTATHLFAWKKCAFARRHHITSTKVGTCLYVEWWLLSCDAPLDWTNKIVWVKFAMYITQKNMLSMVTMPLCWCCFFRTWEQNVKTRELKLSRRRLREWRLNKIYFVVFVSKRLRIARCIYRIHLYEVSKTLHLK